MLLLRQIMETDVNLLRGQRQGKCFSKVHRTWYRFGIACVCVAENPQSHYKAETPTVNLDLFQVSGAAYTRGEQGRFIRRNFYTGWIAHPGSFSEGPLSLLGRPDPSRFCQDIIRKVASVKLE